ncbi:hypothetical protein HPB50_021612 [Hyalomma asiaticum]|uniref:Uncharacterized protein n=1 Tax=Hyalomma asiaticum TaxID=266040 RepID=A0ACB7SYP8_HYAAI|nr:hypothetical protein HPB50_021612 [Hyalomma asiaticum]
MPSFTPSIKASPDAPVISITVIMTAGTHCCREKSTKKLESSGAALTQSVELMLDVQERFATVPNGPVADRVTAKLKAVLDKNPGFYVLKQVSNVLSVISMHANCCGEQSSSSAAAEIATIRSKERR